jgi:hypothetical protein
MQQQPLGVAAHRNGKHGVKLREASVEYLSNVMRHSSSLTVIGQVAWACE